MSKVKSRSIYYVLLGIVGIIMFVAADIYNVIDTFWGGMGIGFAVLSAIRLVQLYRYGTDNSYAEKINVQNNDERNRFLAEKARSTTFYYSILIEAIGIIVLRALDYDKASTIVGLAICVQLVIYWVSYVLLKRKY